MGVPVGDGSGRKGSCAVLRAIVASRGRGWSVRDVAEGRMARVWWGL
jgi:hypothetical protein